jgi:hypothetical protein
VVSSEWSDAPARLARLLGHPGGGKIFGANGHKWQVLPPLSLEELAEVESQLQVRLPGEYRDFLLHVSRGGAGPAYGLFPLRRIDGQWRWDGDGAELTQLPTLTQPFPYAKAFNPADGLPEFPDEEGFASMEEFDDAAEAYMEHHNAVVYSPEHSVGLLYLCHLGCAYREALVVSGSERGRMWADDRAGDAGFRPVLDDDGSRIGFARWYRRWLDEAEAQVSTRR